MMHLVTPSAGGLKYDMTSMITEILQKNEPLEVIHWSRSTGHKNNLAFKSQFVLTENNNQKKLGSNFVEKNLCIRFYIV